MREGDPASFGACVAIEMALQLEKTNCAVAEGLCILARSLIS